MASFRSLLLGNQTDKDKSDVVKAATEPLAPPKPVSPVSDIPPAEDLTGKGMAKELTFAPSMYSRMVARRIEGALAKNPNVKSQLQRLFDQTPDPEEFNKLARPLFEDIGVTKFVDINPHRYMASTATQAGPRQFSAELEQEGLRTGQVDTQELITRGLGATGETVLPNVFKPIEPVKTGGRAEGNKKPFVVGQSQRSGSLDIDEFISRATPDIEALSRRTGRPFDVIAKDVRDGIAGTRTATVTKSKAYGDLITQITDKYDAGKPATADAGVVSGAKSFTGEVPDLTDVNQRSAFANVIGRQIGKQEPGSFLGSLLKKDRTTRLNAITNAAVEGGVDKDTAVSMGRFVESVADVYSTASDSTKTSIASGFSKLIELTTALDNPSLGVPEDVKQDVFKRATSLFENAISGAGNAGTGSTLTSKRTGVDSLANLTDRGLVSWLLSGRNYNEWETKGKRVVGADQENWRSLDKTTVADVETQLTKQVMGAARGIALDRMRKAFSDKYKGTPIGAKQELVMELMTELFKADQEIPLLRNLTDQVKSLVTNMQLGKEMGAGNKRAIDLVNAMDTGSQLNKTGSVFDPVTGQRVTRPAQSLAARLDLTNILEAVLKLDWRGIGNKGFEPEMAYDPKTGKKTVTSKTTDDFDENIRNAIKAVKSKDWGELGFRLEAYSPLTSLEQLLPAVTKSEKTRGAMPQGTTDYSRNSAIRNALVRNMQRILGADLVYKIGGKTFESSELAEQYIETETKKINSASYFTDAQKRANIDRLSVVEPALRAASTNDVVPLTNALLEFKNDKTTALVDAAFAKILRLNPEYAQINKTRPYGFEDKIAYIGANEEVGDIRFWKDFIKFAPAARELFSSMRGGGKPTEVTPDGLPARIQQNRVLLNTQSELAKQLASDKTRPDVGEAVTDFIKGYRRFGISPYMIDETGRTPTGYSPDGLSELIKANPLEWQEFVKSAADVAKAYEAKELTGSMVGNFVRTAVQGTNVSKVARILKYAPNTGGDSVKQLISVLTKIPGQSRAVLGKGKTSSGVAGGTIAGFDRLEELVKTQKILPAQLSGTLLGERSQFAPEKDLFELATNAIKTMANSFGVYDSRLRYYAPAFHDKAKAIEASDASPAVKEARLNQALKEYVESPTAYKGILSKISGRDSASQIRKVRALVALAEQAGGGRPAQKNRGRQNPTAERAIQNVEAGKATTGTVQGEVGPTGAGYKTKTGETVAPDYVRQQFMGELAPEQWLSNVKANIGKWNAANVKAQQVNSTQEKIIVKVADELALGKTIEQLRNSPRFSGKDASALDMALSFLRFEPGSKFDVSNLRAGSLLEGLKPAIPSSKPMKAISAPGDDAGKPKGGRGKGLLSAFKKPAGLLTPLVTPVVQQVIQGRSALSDQVRKENAAKR
jgi:hypothetical protein